MYNNEAELTLEIENYFASIKGELSEDKQTWDVCPEPATITGLALFLGFESKQSIYDYEKSGEFSYPIKKARLRVEHEYEKKLTTAPSPAGTIFALKNFGWSDRTELTGPDGKDIEITLNLNK